MKILGLKDKPVSLLSHKNSDLGIFGDFWGQGANPTQKVDTLAGRRVSSTPGKRSCPTLTHTHSFTHTQPKPHTSARTHTHTHTHIQPKPLTSTHTHTPIHNHTHTHTDTHTPATSGCPLPWQGQRPYSPTC
jgi:ATP-dependent exoDNAse (exonuclease V) beta subunit